MAASWGETQPAPPPARVALSGPRHPRHPGSRTPLQPKRESGLSPGGGRPGGRLAGTVLVGGGPALGASHPDGVVAPGDGLLDHPRNSRRLRRRRAHPRRRRLDPRDTPASSDGSRVASCELDDSPPRRPLPRQFRGNTRHARQMLRSSHGSALSTSGHRRSSSITSSSAAATRARTERAIGPSWPRANAPTRSRTRRPTRPA